MNEFTVRLDLAKGKARQQQTVFVRQGDKNATTIVATITDHGAAAVTSGMTARFQMRLPNGTEYYRKAASLSGNVATVALDETQAASVAGRTDTAYFQLLQGSTVVASTESFTVVVLPDALADATVPESYDSAIQDAIDALDAAVEQMPSTVEDVLADHPEWTTTVQDGSITKAKLATDLAQERERLLYRLDNLLTNALPEGETATATDAAKTPMAGLALYGRSTQDGTPAPSAPVAIQSVAPDSQGNISLWARGRNLLPPGKNSVTQNGVTIARNADGSYAMSGTATATGDLNIAYDAKGLVTLQRGVTYGFKGMYQTKAGVRVLARVDVLGTTTSVKYFNDTGGAAGTYTPAEDGTGVTSCYVNVASGTNVDGLTIYPMFYTGTTTEPFQPYESTVTPIPLDGHELRSLPDGTRDEVTVGADGHAVLVQRVGTWDLSALATSSGWGKSGIARNGFYIHYAAVSGIKPDTHGNALCTVADGAASVSEYYSALNAAWIDTSVSLNLDATVVGSTVAAFKEWLATADVKLVAELATPVTIDLGYVAAAPLVGPDLTAQAVPTASMQLTYERDLNATLARLESAIAELATN